MLINQSILFQYRCTILFTHHQIGYLIPSAIPVELGMIETDFLLLAVSIQIGVADRHHRQALFRGQLNGCPLVAGGETVRFLNRLPIRLEQEQILTTTRPRIEHRCAIILQRHRIPQTLVGFLKSNRIVIRS